MNNDVHRQIRVSYDSRKVRYVPYLVRYANYQSVSYEVSKDKVCSVCLHESGFVRKILDVFCMIT